MAGTCFPLLSLAEELVISIVESVVDLPTLRSLALSCKRLRSLAEPLVYRNAFLRTDDHTKKLLRAIETRQERANAIHYIDARPNGKDVGVDATTDRVVSILETATNLRGLTFESPACNYSPGVRWWQAYERLSGLLGHSLMPGSQLNHLRRLELHLTGPAGIRYWELEKSTAAAIFGHPSLRELIVSCAVLHESALSSVAANKYSTPLERLTLTECNVDGNALKAMLSLPQRLQCLNIGDVCYHGRLAAYQPYPLIQRDPARFLDIVALQSKSLEEVLLVARGGARTDPSVPFSGLTAKQSNGFATFTKLHTLSLIGCQSILPILESESGRAPSLEVLNIRILEADQYSNPFAPGRPRLATWLRTIMRDAVPTLKQLHLTFEDARMRHLPNGFPKDWKHDIRSLESDFQRHGQTFWLYRVASHVTAIPPYLYGEREPEDLLVYASDGRGFLQIKDQRSSRGAGTESS